MEHLSLEIFDLPTKENPNPTGSKYATLEEDSSITITDTSEIFASGDVWSHSFKLNMNANAHIFGTTVDIHGSRLHEQINKRKARLWVEGLPLYMGYLKLGDDAEIDEEGNVDVSFESGQKTFDEMIEGAKANQVPMINDVRIGMALWTKRWVKFGLGVTSWATWQEGAYSLTNGVTNQDGSTTIMAECDGEIEGNSVQEYPRMVFPKGTFKNAVTGIETSIDCVNTDYPYDDAHPYCNIALCYQKYGYDKKYENGIVKPDYSGNPEAQRGYEYMPANRVNSAPNFYVIYWIRCLMKHLGIYIEENQMMNVEDLRRLFFVNTNCDYVMPKQLRTDEVSSRFGKYKFSDKGRLVAEKYDPKQNVDLTKCGFECVSYHLDHIDWDGPTPSFIPTIKDVCINAIALSSWANESEYNEENSFLHVAYATSDCFPNADISEVIKALENGFGIRFLFSDNFQRVRIVLLRNVFRCNEIQDVHCDVLSETKEENSIRGFRMTYGNTEDTAFYYKGFADKLPHMKTLWPDTSDKHDYSFWNLNAKYADIIKKISAFDKTCSVTPNNGNAYGIKIDKDAKRYEDLHPSLFEFASFMDAEDGDCTGEQDSIQEISMGFTPAIMNDLNMEEERNAESSDNLKQRFALFVDETMRPRRPDLGDLEAPASYNDPDAVYSVDKLYTEHGPGSNSPMSDGGIVKPGEFAIASDTYSHIKNLKTCIRELYHIGEGFGNWNYIYYYIDSLEIKGHINEAYRIYLQDNFEPNDDSISPVETHDWGLSLCIMRGSGSDATISYQADPDDKDDNYQNDTWDIVPGSSATAHPDTCDSYGNLWDYNGSTETISTPERAKTVMAQMWPNSNFDLVNRDETNYLTEIAVLNVPGADGNHHFLLFASDTHDGNHISYSVLLKYVGEYFEGQTIEQMFEADKAHLSILIEADSSNERMFTLLNLQRFAFGDGAPVTISGGDNGVGVTEGRFSLKLRAEKPNPYFDITLPAIVTTKAQASEAITKLYKTSDTNLLTRPRITAADLRLEGWEIEGTDDATAFSLMLSLVMSDGLAHNVLWTPVTEEGHILSPEELTSYVDSLTGTASGSLKTADTYHLILDVDTTQARASVLQELQTFYYGDTETAKIDITPANPRYLEIENPDLRNRGLADTFYKEYSYWVRNARIWKGSVRMTLAQLLAIDKTKKVRVGDITGFIRKMQYSVSKTTGLGMVTMEIMYI